MLAVLLLLPVIPTILPGAEVLPPQPSSGRSSFVQVVEDDPVTPVITPHSSDLRIGLFEDVGTLHRTYASGGNDAQDDTYRETGLWLSYTSSILDRAPQWRWEIYASRLEATVSNETSDAGSLATWMAGLGLGFAPDLFATGSGRMQGEIMPFIGVGRSRYDNAYQTVSGGRTYDVAVSGTGPAVEYGIKATLLWIMDSGLEFALQAGVVERRIRLSGETTSTTSQIPLSSSLEVTDVLRGARLGLMAGYRF